MHVGVEIYVCIKPITTSDEKMFKAIFHSFSDVDIEQTRIFIFFIFACCVITSTVSIFPVSKKPNRVDDFFCSFYIGKAKKFSWCYDGTTGIVMWYSVNSLHPVMFHTPEYYSCFWMGNWLIFSLYRLWKSFSVINHSDFEGIYKN